MCLHWGTSAGTAEKAHEELIGNGLCCFTGTYIRTDTKNIVSRLGSEPELTHDVLWTLLNPQVLPLLGCWTSPNVVLGIL